MVRSAVRCRLIATIGKKGYEEMLVAGIVADVANGASGRGTRYDEIVAVQVTEDAFEPGADEGPLMPLGDDDFTALRRHFGMNLRTFASLFSPPLGPELPLIPVVRNSCGGFPQCRPDVDHGNACRPRGILHPGNPVQQALFILHQVHPLMLIVDGQDRRPFGFDLHSSPFRESFRQ